MKRVATIPDVLLPVPSGVDASRLGELYFQWLPSLFCHLVTVRTVATASGPELQIRSLGTTLLRLTPADQGRRQASWSVVGGLLCGRPGGHLSFICEPGGQGMTCLVGFIPTLPPWLYGWTQGPLHGWVMARFARKLRQQAEAVQP